MGKYTAVNAFIFAGSFSIGVMNAGFNLKKVLEISDEQLKQNAFYFHKNYPNIPVILPKEWENDKYLDNLKNEDVDIMCCNCPCSSLSAINRNASVDGKNNVHFYRLFNIFRHVQPKAFVIENAPTLIKLGFPILKDLVNKLNDIYNFTIIHDKAGNHGVAMQRMRTMIVGWRKDYFDKHPLIKEAAKKQLTVKELLADIYTDTIDDCKSKGTEDIRSLYKYCLPGNGLVSCLAKRYNEDADKAVKNEIYETMKNSKQFSSFVALSEKMKNKKNFWDKSPFRPHENGIFPSFSSVQEYLHPVQDRTLNIKELQRIMNYPDTFDFTDDKNECQIPVRQAMAQGVPANFGKWIAKQVMYALDKECDYVDTKDPIVFQNHISHCYSTYSLDEFNNMTELKIKQDCVRL